jgi:hypothetical protein
MVDIARCCRTVLSGLDDDLLEYVCASIGDGADDDSAATGVASCVTIELEDLSEMLAPMLIDAEFAANSDAAESTVRQLWAELHPGHPGADDAAVYANRQPPRPPQLQRQQQQQQEEEQQEEEGKEAAAAAAAAATPKQRTGRTPQSMTTETESVRSSRRRAAGGGGGSKRVRAAPAGGKRAARAAAREAALGAKAKARVEGWLHDAFAEALPELPHEEAVGWAVCLQESLLPDDDATQGEAGGGVCWPQGRQEWLDLLEETVGDGVGGTPACEAIEANLRESGWIQAAEPAEEPPSVEQGTKGMAVLQDDGAWHFCVVTKVRGEGTGLEVMFTEALVRRELEPMDDGL